jgi:hypothetical protein
MKIDILKQIEVDLEDRYLRSLCDLYMLYQRRRGNDIGTTALVRYFRSSAHKDAFGWSMTRAKLVRQPASQTSVCESINVSRQSVSEMIKTCAANKWIEVFCDGILVPNYDVSNCKGTLTYCAGEEMMHMGRAWIHTHIAETENTFLNSNWDDLMAVKRTIKAIL